MKTLLAAVAATCLLAAPASAAEHLINGGFDNGVIGWTGFGPGATRILAGDYLVDFGNTIPDPVTAFLSQTVATVAGTKYELRYDTAGIYSGSVIPSMAASLRIEIIDATNNALIGGGVSGGLITDDLSTLMRTGLDFTALSSLTTVRFSLWRPPSTPAGPVSYLTRTVLDEVSLQDIPGPPTGGIPEPSTWAMMILGFGAAGAMLRRRALVPIRA